MAGRSSITCISCLQWLSAVPGRRNVQAVFSAAVIAFILINVITGSVFGVTADMLSDPAAVTFTLCLERGNPCKWLLHPSVLGAPALNMGVFVGIISGFVRRNCL